MKILFTAFLTMWLSICQADPIISGNSTPQPGSVETYIANWSMNPYYLQYANVTWNVTGGTVVESTKTHCVIQWDTPPSWENLTGSVEAYEDLGGEYGSLTVEILNFTEGTLESCNTVLGPTAVAFNFGTGSNPGPALGGGITTYQYTANCTAVTTGEYTILNSTIGCNSSWLGLPADHTPGDVDGYMLLIDGDNNRGEVFRGQATGLTNAFRYEFSAWIANLSDPDFFQRPRIHFELRDNANNLIVKSGSYLIDYDPSNPWQRLSLMFDIPAGVTSLQVLLVNEHSNASGNDFVVDDIAFAPCYPPIVASFVPHPNISVKTNICNNGSVNLYSWWPTGVVLYTNPGYQWQRSINNGTTWTNISGAISFNYFHTESTPGVYMYRIRAYEISNPSLEVFSNGLTFYVQILVVETKTHYVNGCTSEATQLNPTYYMVYSDPGGPAPIYNFTWSPGTNLSSTTISNPTITLPALPPPNPPNPPNPIPPINYFYNLSVQSTNYIGCAASNTQTVAHINPRKVFIPNAFTPNNDGSNDYFRPVNIQDYTHFGGGSYTCGAYTVERLQFSIYNRWGQRIFYRTSGLTLMDWSWDGKVNGIPQDSGVYVWTLNIPGCPQNYQVMPGINFENCTINGQVTLIR
jgi:hypothetical protein